MSDGDAMAERVWLGAQNRSKVYPVLVDCLVSWLLSYDIDEE